MTLQELLPLWRTLRGFTPLAPDGIMTRTDTPALDTILTAEIDAWYHRLLRHAPLSLLAPEDLASTILLPPVSDGGVTLTLPPTVVRIASVKLSGWTLPAVILTDPSHPLASLQRNPFTRATPSDPVAIFTPGTPPLASPSAETAGGTPALLTLYPATDFDILDSLLCIHHRPGQYTFAPAALGQESGKSIPGSQLLIP